MNNDLINGSFEFLGGIFYIINIVKILKHKEVKGVSWIPAAFFTLWGAWNIYYYPSLNQMFSFLGGIFIFAVNFSWICLVFYYRKK